MAVEGARVLSFNLLLFVIVVDLRSNAPTNSDESCQDNDDYKQHVHRMGVFFNCLGEFLQQS
jgi:hypothetical protein